MFSFIAWRYIWPLGPLPTLPARLGLPPVGWLLRYSHMVAPGALQTGLARPPADRLQPPNQVILGEYHNNQPTGGSPGWWMQGWHTCRPLSICASYEGKPRAVCMHYKLFAPAPDPAHNTPPPRDDGQRHSVLGRHQRPERQHHARAPRRPLHQRGAACGRVQQQESAVAKLVRLRGRCRASRRRQESGT